MSMLPSLRAEFNKNLSLEELKEVAAEIKSLKGVAGVQFRKNADKGTNEVSVTYTQPSVPKQIEAMDGFERFIPGYRF